MRRRSRPHLGLAEARAGLNTLILGGYGNFGARICRALAAECGHGARAARIDAASPQLAAELRAQGVDLVLHTAGPFQQQGYAVARAAAAAGAHYIDLADGRRFVCDFPAALDEAFRAAGRLAISGASTVPALSAAVVDAFTAGWQSLASIDICIAPAQRAPRGLATMAAVLGYCGAPVQVWKDGRWTTAHGWCAPTRVKFARLKPRLGALCDIPDLELFPSRYPGVQTVMFRAALEIGLTQRGLAALGALRRWGLLRRPERLARPLNRAGDALDLFGSSLGGMVVTLKGKDGAGAPVTREWHIAADRDHGPEIPCMAAILLARKLATGALRASGAYTSAGWVALPEFESEFRKWDMVLD